MIITVSREFSSGGRELGKRLAEMLGIAYYDTEVIKQIASETELCEDYIKNITRKGISNFAFHFGGSFEMSYNETAMSVFIAQQNVIKQLAMGGDCLFVGRGADAILAEMKPFRIFVYSDFESKVARCRQKSKTDEFISEKEIAKQMKQIDGNRKKIHTMLSSSDWGDYKSYELCVNTSGREIKALIPSLAAYIKDWYSFR